MIAKTIFLESSTEIAFSDKSNFSIWITKSFSNEANSSKISDFNCSNFATKSSEFLTEIIALASLGMAFLKLPPSIKLN